MQGNAGVTSAPRARGQAEGTQLSTCGANNDPGLAGATSPAVQGWCGVRSHQADPAERAPHEELQERSRLQSGAGGPSRPSGARVREPEARGLRTPSPAPSPARSPRAHRHRCFALQSARHLPPQPDFARKVVHVTSPNPGSARKKATS
jgi:hypothetical protein